MTRLTFHYDAFDDVSRATIIFEDGRPPVSEVINNSVNTMTTALMRVAQEYEVDDMVLAIPDIFKDRINKDISNYSNKKVEVHFV